MGRSASSCFKLITCGGDSADKDDLRLPPSPPPLEIKGSSDKRGWSFRKRSARHRILSNTVISESIPSANKEIQEPAEPDFQKSDASAATEKIALVECTDEKPRLSVSAEPKVSESIVVEKDDSAVDSRLEESVIIVIQAAVRGFLARRELQKLKNVVRLQAAVRGHIVRQHAVGTLRCVQAIVKMQALVRARHARLSNEKSSVENESHREPGKASSKFLDKERTETTYISIEKLLSNKFARQLIESTPKNKPINIKCDPSKPNSAWNWLERWMPVSSAEPTPKPESSSEELERAKVEVVTKQEEANAPSERTGEPADLESSSKEAVLASESEESLITYEGENLKSEAIPPTPAAGDTPEEREIPTSEEREIPVTNYSVNQVEQSGVSSEVTPGSAVHDPKPEVEQPDQPKRSMKRVASDELETEGKKHVFGSRKGSNPSFIAAQSKFEEMSSASNLNKSANQDVVVGSKMDAVSSGSETATRTTEVNIIETAVSHNSALQYGDSECGTELSVTSTLDSPDRSDAGVVHDEHEAKIGGEEAYNSNASTGADAEGKIASNTVAQDSSSLVVNKHEKIDVSEGESTNVTLAEDSPPKEVKAERSASDVQGAPDTETGIPEADGRSPAASPRSHVTVPESQGTPSSQVSVKTKKNRTDKSSSSQKRKSLSAGKHSPSHLSHDAGVRSSMEQLHKDQQNGKRRNSFGSPRPDQRDDDPRDSNSSSSLPHFMQATESARAKMNANNSPRSSPEVQDREYMKKRHSLPGANGRQGSPHVRRSMPQAQQGAKGNGSYVVHEKKWQR